MTGYLKLDSTRISFGEYWRWKPSPAFLILAIMKALGIRFPTTVLVPAVASVELVDPLMQPRELTAMLDQPLRACQERGYVLNFFYTVPTLGNIVGIGAALQSGDGYSVALALAAQTRNGVNREMHVGVLSRLRNGRFLGTSDQTSVFRAAPVMEGVQLRGASAPKVIDAHTARMNARRSELVPAGDPVELIRQIEQVQVDANLARGVYVPANQADVAKAVQLQGPRW